MGIDIRQAFHEGTAANRAERAINLIERGGIWPVKIACSLRECDYLTDEQRFKRAMQLLPHLTEFFSDVDAPDTHWWKDYFLLSGDHMVLTEEGWEPGDIDRDGIEILDEVNKPKESVCR